MQIGQGETTKAWSSIGSLARTVQYLHLSVEDTNLVKPAALLSNLPSLQPPCDWIEEEERRRLFWNVFVLDRYDSRLLETNFLYSVALTFFEVLLHHYWV
jgi:hypothetical protein